MNEPRIEKALAALLRSIFLKQSIIEEMAALKKTMEENLLVDELRNSHVVSVDGEGLPFTITKDTNSPHHILTYEGVEIKLGTNGDESKIPERIFQDCLGFKNNQRPI